MRTDVAFVSRCGTLSNSMISSWLLIFRRMKNYNKNDNTIAYIYSPDSFISSFMDIYNIKPQFKNSLLVLLLKAAVEKISGMGDLRYSNNVVNFYSMLEATSRKVFEAVLENLIGHCLCQIPKAN